MDISFFTVSKDEFEAGDCPTCSACGATIRHVTKIDGRFYGSGCGKLIIETALKQEKERKDKIATIVEIMGNNSAPNILANWSDEQIKQSRDYAVTNATKNKEAWLLIAELRNIL